MKFAFRSLLKTPIVTTIAVLSIALGIGANVAIFSIFNQTLLRPLPVHEPDGLVNFVSAGPRSGWSSCGQAGNCDGVFSYQMFRDLERVQTVRRESRVRRGVGGWRRILCLGQLFPGARVGARSRPAAGTE